MSQNTKQRFHPEVRTADLPNIKKKFGTDYTGLEECQQQIDAALKRIQIYPDREGKICKYEPLSSAGFRKVKLFSNKKPPVGSTPDLRIIYRYNINEDAIEVLVIGFRIKQRPRPPEDPYSLAGEREFLF
ncbi:hypothetical protein [Paenibacillus sp. FSL K6-1318]|uniref:hypothetical protein n=1 Tax=Paenibacillus sp. FSL K6-1318 TaxID=2975291 RepID=UPI0030EE9F09